MKNSWILYIIIPVVALLALVMAITVLAGQAGAEECNYLLFGTNEPYLNKDNIVSWGRISDTFHSCSETLEEAQGKMQLSHWWEDLEFLYLFKIEEIPLKKKMKTITVEQKVFYWMLEED